MTGRTGLRAVSRELSVRDNSIHRTEQPLIIILFSVLILYIEQ